MLLSLHSLLLLVIVCGGGKDGALALVLCVRSVNMDPIFEMHLHYSVLEANVVILSGFFICHFG